MKNSITLLLALCLYLVTFSQTNPELPVISNGDNIPYPKGYIVYEIKDGLYYVGDGIYNAMFLVYDKGVVAIDAPPTIGEKYLQAIKEVTKLPVTHLVYSHSHTDHIGAAYLFNKKDLKIISQRETADILKMRNDKRRPIPNTVFDKSLTLNLGKQTLQLDYKGNNHEPGNIFIYAPRQQTLMLVDIVYPGWVPFKNLGIAQDVQGYIKAHDDALSYPFTKIVSGHVNRIGTREDVETAKRFVTDLKQSAIASFGEVNIMDVIKETGTDDKWKMYNTYFERVVTVAETKMKKLWAGKLGGLSTYLHDDCWIMCEAVNVDFAAGQ